MFHYVNIIARLTILSHASFEPRLGEPSILAMALFALGLILMGVGLEGIAVLSLIGGLVALLIKDRNDWI